MPFQIFDPSLKKKKKKKKTTFDLDAALAQTGNEDGNPDQNEKENLEPVETENTGNDTTIQEDVGGFDDDFDLDMDFSKTKKKKKKKKDLDELVAEEERERAEDKGNGMYQIIL